MSAVIEGEKRAFLTGNEVVSWACLAAGAQAMYGYPITPQNEIMHHWSRMAPRYGRTFLQTEDELSAGYATLGAVLAGVKAFTATAGPGHVLMQEPFSMAEMMCLPIVAVITQRGGPSTATVIYSQQEVNLACSGGNGEGFRLVYSVAGLQDLYVYTIKAFGMAWRYRIPTFVLGDGYQSKMRGAVTLFDPKTRGLDSGEAEPLLALPGIPGVDRPPVHLRNTYNLEEELEQIILERAAVFAQLSSEAVEYEEEETGVPEVLIVAHGIVAKAAKAAAARWRRKGASVGYFRPITLRPFPGKALASVAARAGRILVAESAHGQLDGMVREALYGLDTPISGYLRPGVGITPEELEEEVGRILSNCRTAAISADYAGRSDFHAGRTSNAQGMAAADQTP